MNNEQVNGWERDPLTDDPNFDFKRWVFNSVHLKPYWPLGSLPQSTCEIIAGLLHRNVGKWVSIKNLDAVSFWASTAVKVCRHRYGMVIEERAFFGRMYFRWKGTFRGNVDDRIITEQMRQEERNLLESQVKLQAENFELLQSYRQLQARFRKWSLQKELYHKRVRSLRRKLSRLNPTRIHDRFPEGVDDWPRGLCARWYRQRNGFGRPRRRHRRAA